MRLHYAERRISGQSRHQDAGPKRDRSGVCAPANLPHHFPERMRGVSAQARCRSNAHTHVTTTNTKNEGAISLASHRPPIPIFGDPVRLPDHNFGSPRITRHSRTHARVFLALLRSLLPQEPSRRHPFPVAWPESRCRFSKMTVCPLSPLEDCSSVESNTTPGERVCKGSRIIFCCGNE